MPPISSSYAAKKNSSINGQGDQQSARNGFTKHKSGSSTKLAATLSKELGASGQVRNGPTVASSRKNTANDYLEPEDKSKKAKRAAEQAARLSERQSERDADRKGSKKVEKASSKEMEKMSSRNEIKSSRNKVGPGAFIQPGQKPVMNFGGSLPMFGGMAGMHGPLAMGNNSLFHAINYGMAMQRGLVGGRPMAKMQT